MGASSEPPTGYHTITPRIFVDDPARLVAFLRTVFDASGDIHGDRPSEIGMDRLAMVRDPLGNVFQVAHRIH